MKNRDYWTRTLPVLPTPEHNLWWAVIRKAITDHLGGEGETDYIPQEYQDSARSFLFGPSSWAVHFGVICKMAGTSPTYIRRKLAETQREMQRMGIKKLSDLRRYRSEHKHKTVKYVGGEFPKGEG